jgi:hypothetical protein
MKTKSAKQILEDRLRTKCASYTASTNELFKQALLSEIADLCKHIYPDKAKKGTYGE